MSTPQAPTNDPVHAILPGEDEYGGDMARDIAAIRTVLTADGPHGGISTLARDNAAWFLLECARPLTENRRVTFYRRLLAEADRVGDPPARTADGTVRVAARIAARWTARVLRRSGSSVLPGLLDETADNWWGNPHVGSRTADVTRLRRAMVVDAPDDPALRRIVDDMIRKGTNGIQRRSLAAEGYMLRSAATAVVHAGYARRHLGYVTSAVLSPKAAGSSSSATVANADEGTPRPSTARQ
ncbi:hypothetical protein [Embleya scabrispora]|uniref:hypothetical protein n=1 Tax=Embleya scabrispora TaxID=159449 RepID=UPI00117C6558|nr:hypothetical protein [Embleya scabrispora]